MERKTVKDPPSKEYAANRRVFVAFSAPKGIIDYNGIHCGIEVLCMKHYRKRIADHILKRKLEGKGAVLIEGPKWCGKTTTAEQIAASVLYMDDPEKRTKHHHVRAEPQASAARCSAAADRRVAAM